MQASDVGARPRFRQDLVAEPVEEQGSRFIDVMDPDNGAVFRFYEVEYALACAMDGERDVAGIVKWAQEELGLTPSPSEVQTVIATLADLRFVQGADQADAKVARGAPTTAEHVPAPAAKPAATDDELARGIVVGRTAQAELPVADVELGGAGSLAAASAKSEALPSADIALGAPGAAATKGPPKPPVEEVSLGAPGASGAAAKKPQSEVSIDLKDHLAIKPDDVKEAVRASKVMAAVEMPKELVEAEQSAAKGAAKQEAKQAEKASEKAPEKVAAKAAEKQPEAKAADKKAEAKADKAADKKAEAKADKAADKKAEVKPARELPRQPTVDKTPVAPPAPQTGPSPVLVIALILVIVGAGAFAVWKFVLNKPEENLSSQKAPPPAPLPPPPPAEVMARVVLETPAPIEVKAPVAGTIETIAADKDVSLGEVVATLAGGKPFTTQITTLNADITRLTPALEKAQKALDDAQQVENNQAGVAKAQAAFDKAKKAVDDKKAALDKAQTELDKLSIKATSDGKVTEAVAANTKVAADQVLAKVAAPTAATATFKIPSGTKLSNDGSVSLTAGDQTVVCTISDMQAETVKVTCPADAGLTDGADVKFTLPK